MTKEFNSESPEDTFQIASDFGAALEGGEIVLFKGSLGVGKTLFTKGLMHGLGYDEDEVNSPSFALVNNYRGKFDVYHIDLWRLEGEVDRSFAVGLDEMLDDEDSIIIIEWAEKIEGFDFGRPVIVVGIEGNGDQPRLINIRAADM